MSSLWGYKQKNSDWTRKTLVDSTNRKCMCHKSIEQADVFHVLLKQGAFNNQDWSSFNKELEHDSSLIRSSNLKNHFRISSSSIHILCGNNSCLGREQYGNKPGIKWLKPLQRGQPGETVLTISQTQDSRKGHQQIGEGPIAPTTCKRTRKMDGKFGGHHFDWNMMYPLVV